MAVPAAGVEYLILLFKNLFLVVQFVLPSFAFPIDASPHSCLVDAVVTHTLSSTFLSL